MTTGSRIYARGRSNLLVLSIFVSAIVWTLHSQTKVNRRILDNEAAYLVNVEEFSTPFVNGSRSLVNTLFIASRNVSKRTPEIAVESTDAVIPLPVSDNLPNNETKVRQILISTHQAKSLSREKRKRKKIVSTMDNSYIKQLRDGFQAKHAPIMSQDPDENRPVRIRILLFENKRKSIGFRRDSTWAISDELLNICMDGFEKSPFFELLDHAVIPDDPDYFLQEDNDVVWVVDMRRFVEAKEYSTIEQTVWLVNRTLEHQAKSAIQPKLKVVFMDWRDRRSMSLCRNGGTRQLLELLGSENVRLVTQQIVEGRKWENQAQFVSQGFIADSRLWRMCLPDYPALHMPYTVRSDYAMAMQSKFPLYLLGPSKKNSLNALPSDTYRPVDVAHFWSTETRDSNTKLRDAVTRTVLSLNKTLVQERVIQVIGDVVSESGGAGRTSYQEKYIHALLTTKIVVVAQRDTYEDHYRLFEAIIGGACVLTDTMLSLPDGYEHGKNILVYSSLGDLKRLILYYLNHEDERLNVARNGWKLAMNQHRTFHWMEELFFGKPLTNITMC